MTIPREHIVYYRQIFSIKNLIREPILMIGLPTIDGVLIPADFRQSDLKELFKSKGFKKIKVLDLFDPTADYRLDLNLALSSKFNNKYNLVIDIGTIEHIFDTAQVIKNYVKLTKLNGHILLLTCVNGYFGHGLHVFNPNSIVDAFEKNGFKIIYKKYLSSTGIEINDPSITRNILMFLVAKKVKSVSKFVVPQQMYWKNLYAKKPVKFSDNVYLKLKAYLEDIKRNTINKIPIEIRTRLYKK